jgi:hypothetical protein
MRPRAFVAVAFADGADNQEKEPDLRYELTSGA